MKVVTGKVVADTLGLTERRIRQLRQDGVIKETSYGSGLYRLPEAVQAYIAFITKGETSDGSAALDLSREKALLMKAKRESEEYDLMLKRGDLHQTEEIRQIISGMLANFRSRLLSIPSKASPELAVKSDKAEIHEILKRLVDEALNELADFDEMFPENDDQQNDDVKGGNTNEKNS